MGRDGSRSGRRGLVALYAAEAVNSIAGTLLTVGLPFYTSHRFGWGAKENFATAALQGAFYVIGALLAKRISRRWGRQPSLLALYACMTAVAVAVAVSASAGWAVGTALLVVLETGLMASSWPMLESLISASGAPSQLSQRLGWYNIVWATTGALALAGSGAIIQHTPPWGFFGVVAAVHLTAGLLILYRRLSSAARPEVSIESEPNGSRLVSIALDEAALRRNRLALCLSRIALPSTYVIIYSLAPALPSLHAIKQLSPSTATLAASVWLIARAAAFVVTGHTDFWHKKPWLMLQASATMLLAFIGVVVFGALGSLDLTSALAAMAVAQIVLGASLGMIYAASLYFGMAVSEGSTEHGGYHEALIGLGQILGPLVGVSMQVIFPGAIWPAVLGISGVVCVTLSVEAVVGVRVARGQAPKSEPVSGEAAEAMDNGTLRKS